RGRGAAPARRAGGRRPAHAARERGALVEGRGAGGRGSDEPPVPRQGRPDRGRLTMDDASMLADRDERAIETIGRQLDRESPPTPRGVAFAWDVDTHAAAAVVPPPRRTGRVAVVIGALLVAFTLGAAAGAAVATLVLRDAPLGVEPDERRPAALTPPPAPAPPKPRPVTSSPPRPSRA